MRYKDYASKIAKREGKKSQTHIGNIREILKIIVEIEAEELLKICKKTGYHLNPTDELVGFCTPLTVHIQKKAHKLQKKRAKQ